MYDSLLNSLLYLKTICCQCCLSDEQRFTQKMACKADMACKIYMFLSTPRASSKSNYWSVIWDFSTCIKKIIHRINLVDINGTYLSQGVLKQIEYSSQGQKFRRRSVKIRVPVAARHFPRIVLALKIGKFGPFLSLTRWSLISWKCQN